MPDDEVALDAVDGQRRRLEREIIGPRSGEWSFIVCDARIRLSRHSCAHFRRLLVPLDGVRQHLTEAQDVTDLSIHVASYSCNRAQMRDFGHVPLVFLRILLLCIVSSKNRVRIIVPLVHRNQPT